MTRHCTTVFAVRVPTIFGMVALLAATTMHRVHADPPVAPGPESVQIDAHVMPAALVAEPDGQAGGPGPVSLGPSRGAASPPPIRPLPDWKLLAAMGAAFAAVAAYRLFSVRRGPTLPPDVFEVLGEAAISGQQSVRVVRFGPRTLLLGVSSAGCQTLAEITDPQATDCIVAACRGTRLRGHPAAVVRRHVRGAGPAAAEARA